MARKPETTWEMLNVAMAYYKDYIGKKDDRCSVSVIDLLYVSNFKGGNASITEPIESLKEKLKYYEYQLKAIDKLFKEKVLSSISDVEKEILIDLCTGFLYLTEKEDSSIRGLGPSYASALLAAHFIELIPVLDRRALNGAGIDVEKDKQGAVKKISSHYASLINSFVEELRRAPGMKLRELDKKWFIKEL